MPLNPGSHLGPYLIVNLLGAGGMGEVYRARDEGLGREVAIKVLPAGFAADPDRLRRFTQEAQAAAALNHPNILAIHHIGQHEGTPFIVSELLEGDTLHQHLRGGALPVRKAVDYAVQTARGLAAAHERGVVHRDLKPDNLFITNDGRVKILDFGLAKLTRGDDAAAPAEHATISARTEAGTVLGTVGYMSPEQVRAQPVDARTDIFSLGTILYEMLSGARAFRRETPADTLSAILREEPADLAVANETIPPALERIVRHCLEKSPNERFQSARDLAFDLSEISAFSGVSRSGVPAETPSPRRRGRLAAAAAGIAITSALVAVLVVFWAQSPVGTIQPTFQRLTFRRGTVLTARFAPDRKTVVYGAAWDGGAPETFVATAGSPESRSLGLMRSDVYAVSSTGELALSRRTGGPFPPEAGTLARVPLFGGAAPRSVIDHVEFADWGPEGSLAVTLDTGVGDRLEYPIGTPLLAQPGPIHQLRVSPDGTRVAFQEQDGGRTSVSTVDKSRTKRVLSSGWLAVDGLAWAPAGREIWFAGLSADDGWGLHGVTLEGAARLILRIPGPLHLQDVSADGTVLLARDSTERGIRFMAPGGDHEIDLSWLDSSVVGALSRDGRQLLFSEVGEAGGSEGAVYLRGTDGSPAVRLGDGLALDLSPDGRWALSMARSRRAITLLPTGIGKPETLGGRFDRYWDAQWLPEGRRVLFSAMTGGHDPRLYVQDLSGEPRPISPEGLLSRAAVSPDGRRVLVELGGKPVLLNSQGGQAQPVAGMQPGDVPVAWSSDGSSVYVARPDIAATVDRVDLATGRRTLWKVLMPADRSGVVGVWNVQIAGDGQSYAYSYIRTLSELYLVRGLR